MYLQRTERMQCTFNRAPFEWVTKNSANHFTFICPVSFHFCWRLANCLPHWIVLKFIHELQLFHWCWAVCLAKYNFIHKTHCILIFLPLMWTNGEFLVDTIIAIAMECDLFWQQKCKIISAFPHHLNRTCSRYEYDWGYAMKQGSAFCTYSRIWRNFKIIKMNFDALVDFPCFFTRVTGKKVERANIKIIFYQMRYS